jgi:NAD(P)-dependent dehydrogenase (short-subunit alcohol dehydrogenase family)
VTVSSGRLQGKRALVTGAGTGIGRAVAVRFAEEGASVALVGRRREPLEETAALIRGVGGTGLVTPCDVSREDQVISAVAASVEAFGGLDTVVGVAGIELMGVGDDRIDRLDLSIWQQTIDINLTGMFLTCKHGTRALLASGGGSITITGSPCGLLGFCSDQAAYSAAKSGTHGLVRGMAADLAPEHIRVNCVIPGFIATPLTRSVFEDPAWLGSLEKSIPLHRAGQPEEVAGMYAWLASDDASYVTGAFFTVDGGETAV